MGKWQANEGKRVLNALLIAGVALACVFALRFSSFPESFDRLLWEARFELDHRPVSGQIVQVDIDAKSLDQLGVWPLPRRIFAKMTDNLSAAGAQEIVFDVDFSSASNPEDDQILARAFENAGNVSLAAFRQAASSDSADGDVFNMPIEPLAAVAWPVVVMVPMEKDSRIWRNLYGFEIDGSAEMSAAALMGEHSGQTLGAFRLDYSIAIDQLERVSLVDVVNGNFDPAVFEGRKVIVGASALELRDLFAVPVFEILPGSIIQALGAETLLQQREMIRKGELFALAFAMLVFFALLASRREGWLIKVGILALAALTLELVALVLQINAPILLPTATAHFLLFSAAICVLIIELGFLRLISHLATIKHFNSQRMLGQVFDDSFDAIIVLDTNGNITAASNVARDLFENNKLVGKEARSVLPQTLADEALAILNSSADITPAPRILPLALSNGKKQVIEFVVTRSQSRVARGTGRKDDETKAVACITCRDVTEEREYADRLRYLAQNDPVTGLLNRNGLEAAYDTQATFPIEGQVYCLVQFAIANFDQIVASLGSSYGEMTRRAVAARLRNHFSDGVTWATVTGNVFAGLFVCERNKDRETRIVETIHNIIGEDYIVEGSRISIQLKFGYAVCDADTTIETMLRRSGNALARARREVRTPVVAYVDKMDEGLRRRRKLETELFKAISRDELSLAYQPLVDLKDGSIFGVEALLRWEHRELGMVSPAEFVPIAEENGYIVDIGAWALNRGMKEALAWSLPLRLSINLSAIQFARSNIVSTVKEAIERTRFPAERLDLEVTESLFIDESLDLRFCMEELKSLECSFSLDDFGTGYSSLSYVDKYPFSKIKLDRAFVRETFTDKKDLAVIEAVVHLAKGHDMALLVEGIENPHQAEVLRDLGCDFGQGYLYGKPMTAVEIESLLKAAA